MKRILITFNIILVIILFTPDFSHSFRNEVCGYKGFKWGTALEEFLASDRIKLKKSGKIYYVEKINGINVDIGYEFFKDKLLGVKINFPEDKRSDIIDHFTMLHGEPTLKRGKYLYWVGTTTKIEIKRKDVLIVDKELEKEYFLEKQKSKK